MTHSRRYLKEFWFINSLVGKDQRGNELDEKLIQFLSPIRLIKNESYPVGNDSQKTPVSPILTRMNLKLKTDIKTIQATASRRA